MSASFGRAYEEAAIIPGQPIPIRPSVPEAGEFPLDYLPPILKNAVEATVDLVRLPVSLAAGAALATASLVVQAYVNVELPTGEVVPTSNYFASVGKSGERKSSAEKRLLHAVKLFEQELRAKMTPLLAEYQTKKEAYAASRKKAVTGNKNRNQIEDALAQCGSEPIAPPAAILLVEEPTIAALHKLFAEALPSLGLFSDEGGQLIGGHAMSAENRVQAGAALSKIWDGATIKRVRASEAVSFLPGRRLAFHIMIQPLVARELFGDEKLKDQGLLSRMLVAHPKSTQGERFWRDPSADSILDLEKFNARVDALLRGDMPMDPETRALSPAVMTLSDDARTMFIQWHDACEAELRKGGAFENISGFAAKLPEHSVRLAAVMSYFSNKQVAPISAAALAAGIKLAQFYASEALRLFGVGSADQDTENAATLMAWVRDNEFTIVGARLLSRHGPGKLSGPAFQRALAIMTDLGHLVAINGRHEVIYNGKSANYSECYRVVAEEDDE